MGRALEHHPGRPAARGPYERARAMLERLRARARGRDTTEWLELADALADLAQLAVIVEEDQRRGG